MKNLIKSGKTKIVATIGPATSDQETIEKLIMAGASMFRLNTSHGSKDIHEENIKKIRKAEEKLDVSIPKLITGRTNFIRIHRIGAY